MRSMMVHVSVDVSHEHLFYDCCAFRASKRGCSQLPMVVAAESTVGLVYAYLASTVTELLGMTIGSTGIVEGAATALKARSG